MPTVQGIDTPSGKRSFQRVLLRWYDLNKRDLPWRRQHDPYRIWVSEIMLQQTRVNAVLEHYRKFLERFPKIENLAAAREASVLASWSGLGYYRRARMMHAAAKKVVKEYDGEFPANEQDLRTLPGIGRYTAAAIASIAFGEPTAVVDGNVERVLQRLSGKSVNVEQLWESANAVLDQKRPGDFNQAMMELGATVCLPRGPLCTVCPIFTLCRARGEMASDRVSSRQQKRGDQLRTGAAKGNCIFSPTSNGGIANGRDVGIAGRTDEPQHERYLPYFPALDYSYGLHGASDAGTNS